MADGTNLEGELCELRQKKSFDQEHREKAEKKILPDQATPEKQNPIIEQLEITKMDLQTKLNDVKSKLNDAHAIKEVSEERIKQNKQLILDLKIGFVDITMSVLSFFENYLSKN